MCSLKILVQLIKQIDIYRKHCLWSKGDINRRGGCLIAQETACKPKNQGGLGIIDIKSQNSALLMKFLDKFYNEAEIPWVSLTWSKFYSNSQTPPQSRSPIGSFWWKDIMTLFDKFRDLAICNPSNGRIVLFQADKWSDQSLQELYPQLLSSTKKKKCSIRFFLNQDVSKIFSLPLSTQATNQLEEVQTLIQQRTWNANTKDIWCYSWGSCK